MDQVVQFLAQGRKLDAIRAYRELTGAGLHQAMDAVNALEQGMSLAANLAAGVPAQPAGWEAEALALVRANRKIDAVALVRRQTGQNLQDALRTVEALEAGSRPAWRPAPPTGDPVRDLLQQGNKLEAIKVYMTRHRAGLKEAKDAVDALEREMGRS